MERGALKPALARRLREATEAADRIATAQVAPAAADP
jgi:hypothetical protein